MLGGEAEQPHWVRLNPAHSHQRVLPQYRFWPGMLWAGRLRFKEQTDLSLLERSIAPSLGRKEFWLRKAIGWALRQYAWTDPAFTRRYVKAHEHELSGLSKREALKNIGG